MIPPSDSLGRTAGVFPSERHSPVAVPTQWVIRLFQFRALIYAVSANGPTSSKAAANANTFMNMRKWCPLCRDRSEESTTSPGGN